MFQSYALNIKYCFGNQLIKKLTLWKISRNPEKFEFSDFFLFNSEFFLKATEIQPTISQISFWIFPIFNCPFYMSWLLNYENKMLYLTHVQQVIYYKCSYFIKYLISLYVPNVVTLLKIWYNVEPIFDATVAATIRW